MKFTLNRNYVLASTMGHTIAFEKGKATHVPPHLYKEARAIGALPEDETAIDDDESVVIVTVIAGRD